MKQNDNFYEIANDAREERIYTRCRECLREFKDTGYEDDDYQNIQDSGKCINCLEK